jgi:hypothetical protein
LFCCRTVKQQDDGESIADKVGKTGFTTSQPMLFLAIGCVDNQCVVAPSHSNPRIIRLLYTGSDVLNVIVNTVVDRPMKGGEAEDPTGSFVDNSNAVQVALRTTKAVTAVA